MNKRNTEKDFTVARGEIERVIEEFQELVDREASHDPENTGLEQILQGLKRVEQKRREQSFQVAVLALAKSGKSTLINALLGAEYLPSSNIPETARIVGIRHEPTVVNESVLDKAGAKIATGVTEIREKLRELNAAQRKVDSVLAEDDLTLSAPLVCLAERSLGEQRFEVLDTPGPNEAGADILREKVDGLLRNADVIIYLLDYTKLKTEEEKCLFTRLSSMRRELLKQCSERLFFVVNKIDLQDRSGLSLEETRKYVADLLSKQVSGLNVPLEQVLLVSAAEGLLARIVESGQAEEKVIHDFAKRAFGVFHENATIEECRLFAPRMLDKSKLVVLEENIISFIYANRGRLSLQSLVDDLERQRKPFANYLRTTSQSLETDIDELAQKCRQLEHDLKIADEDFNEVDSLSSRVEKEVEELVRGQFSNFSDIVKQELSNAREQTPSSWDNVKDVFARLLDEAKDKETAERRLEEANRSIAEKLKTEFDIFYTNLEEEMWKRQKRLFKEIESKLEPLAQRIEDMVGKSLDISLNPVQIQIPALSIDEFHSQIQERKNDLIKTARRMEWVWATERGLVKKGGWSGKDEYGDIRTLKKTGKDVYELSSDDLLNFWLVWIKEKTEVSVKTANHIIGKEIRDVAKSARKEIRHYGDLYVQTMRRSLKKAERVEERREARLEEVKAADEKLLKLKHEIEKCHEFLAAQA